MTYSFDPRHSTPCRKAIATLTQGPTYRMGHYFGRRKQPLIHIRIAGRLITAGLARMTHTGRPDRPGVMLHLSDYGKAMAMVLAGGK